MKAVKAFLALGIAAASVVSAQTTPAQQTDRRFRIGAVLGTNLNDIEGGHGSLSVTVTNGRTFGADIAVEYSRGRRGLELGATWLKFRYDEPYRISHGVYDSTEGRGSGSANFLQVHSAFLVHIPITAKSELAVGPLLGLSAKNQELFKGGLTYGGKAVLDHRKPGDRRWFTCGLQVVVADTAFEYRGESLPMILATVGIGYR